MNIVMVHPHDLFDVSEPWTVRIKNIAEQFVKKGHSVKLCYFPLRSSSIPLQSHFNSIELIAFERLPSPRIFLSNMIRFMHVFPWADVVHFQKCHHYASLPAVCAAYFVSRPLLYDWDDWEEKIWYESCGRGFHQKFIGVSFRILERWLPILADAVSCASKHLKHLARHYGVADEYLYDSPVGADLEHFHPGVDGTWVKEKYGIKEDVVMYVGQLHGAQYVDLFIRAAKNVLTRHPRVTFMVVGEGFMENNLRRLAEQLGLNSSMIFTGAVSHADVPSYIAAATVCVAPFSDTPVTRCKSPLKIVEYLASGKPIVASDVGEVRHMVGGAGILVRAGDWQALSDGVTKFLSDEKFRIQAAGLARQRAEREYNWQRTADSLLSAYTKIIA